MKRLTSVVAATATVFGATQALASDWKGQPLTVKRQLVTQVVDCMKKRMSADRHISYNRASKECRDQMGSRVDKTSPAAPLVAADTSAK